MKSNQAMRNDDDKYTDEEVARRRVDRAMPRWVKYLIWILVPPLFAALPAGLIYRYFGGRSEWFLKFLILYFFLAFAIVVALGLFMNIRAGGAIGVSAKLFGLGLRSNLPGDETWLTIHRTPRRYWIVWTLGLIIGVLPPLGFAVWFLLRPRT